MSATQRIKTKGGTEFVLLEAEDYDALLQEIEDLQDIASAAKIMKEEEGKERVPFELLMRLEKEPPIAVWLDYKGMKQVDLVNRTGLSQPYISLLVQGEKKGSLKTYKAIAKALDIDLEDITTYL